MDNADKWLKVIYDNSSVEAKQKILSSVDINPQSAVKSIQIARDEGVPIAFAPSEPDPQAELKLKLRRQADALDRSPTFAKWLGKQPPIVVGAVNDDIENLSNLDAVAQELKNIAGAIASSAPAFNAGAWGLVRAAGEALPDVLGQPVVGLAKQYAEQQKALADDLMPQGGNLFSQSVYGGLQSAGLSLMTLPLGLAAGPTAMMAPALTQVLGDSYTKARDEGLSGTRALTHAIEIAGLEYVSEKIPAGRLIDDLVQGSGLGQTLMRQLAAELPGEQFATLTQDFTEWANLNPDKSLKQFVEERPEAMLSTAIATLTGSTATVLTAKGVERIANKVLRDDGKLREANDSGTALQKMAEMVAATETAKRDVETFEGFLQTAFEGSAADNVYIDANILRDSGLAPVLAQKSETVAAQMEQAAVGTMVRIPIAEVMGRFNQELQPLLPDLRVTPEGLSQREAENYMAEEGNALQALVERALQQDAQDEAIVQQRTQIADEIAAQIEETGRARPEVAALYGRLVASFYATQAQRIGITPMQLWESRKLKVEKGNMVLLSDKEATDLLQTVYHGTPHRFEPTPDNPLGEFRASQIGTGEGAQAYGHGVYVAESPAVAKSYVSAGGSRTTKPDAYAADIVGMMGGEQKALAHLKSIMPKKGETTFSGESSEFIEQAIRNIKSGAYKARQGNLYTADLPDEMVDRMLDWDKPLTKQSFDVQKKIQQVIDQEFGKGTWSAWAKSNPDYRDLRDSLFENKTEPEISELFRQAGIPGIKYLDAGSRGDKAKPTRNFVIFPGEEKNVKIYKRNEEFLQEEQKIIRGSFAPNELTIRLTKASDLSTFLHESGHLFFHMMADLAAQPNANAAIVKDTDALLKWVGIEPTPEQSRAEVWGSMPIAEQDQYHEMMARGFEVYLSEGKAPSVELRSAFATFRAWLLNVYKQILQAVKTGGMQKALNVQLNAEVRSVMDRLLATEEEIEAAEAMTSMGMMFGSQAEAEKFKLDWQAYQAQGKAATDEAVSELGARSIKDMKWLDNAKSRMLRQLQKEEKALRSEARIEARREILQQPIYRAMAFLTAPIRPELAARRQALKNNFREVDPSKDSMLMAIAKLGGIKDLPGELGYDPKDLKQAVKDMGLGPSFTLSGKNSRSADHMGEALFDLGYLAEDEFGRYDLAEMDKKIEDSLSGNDHYSTRFDYDFYFEADNILIDEKSDNWGGRIRTDRVPAMFKEALKAKGVMRKVGDNPDVIAELYGFSSGMELMQKLADALSPRDAIEQRTDQIMLERHSELATPEARNEAVNAALANDARTKMVATEMNALERALRGGKGKATPAAAAKAFAQQILARMKIIDIRPTQFSASAARAAKAADKARKKGDIAEAAIEKRNELVNLYATKLATDAKTEVQKGLDYIARLKGKTARQKIDIEQLDQIDNILELYEFKRVSAAELERRQSLNDWIAQQEEEGFVVDMPDKVRNRVRATNFQTLSLEDFRGVIDSLKQIEHIGRLKTKLILSAKNRAISEVVAEVKNEIAQNKTLKPLDDRARSTIGAQLKQAFKAFTASHRKMASIVYQIDNFKLGPLWEALVRTANERSDWEANKQAELTTRLAKLQKLVKKDFGFSKGQFFSGINDSLTTDERLVVALNWGNLGNRQRLLDGRGWTVEGVQEVLDTLTENEWKYVQGVWETFDSLRPEIAAKERKLMNKEPDWIEPAEVQTKYGTLKGGYYPIVYDTRLSGKAAQDESAEAAKRQLQSARIAAQTRRGYVKSRAEKVTDRPVLLTTDGMFRGLNDVVHDLAFHEWAIDANRLTKALDPVIRQAYGADLMNQILSAKDAIIAGENIQPTGLDRFLRRIRVGSMVNGLGFNLTTSLMQPLGLTQSMVRVGKIPVLKAVAKFAGNPVGVWKDVLSKSAMMRNRASTRDRELNELRNGLRKTNDVRQFIDKAMFVPMSMMQMTIDIPTWLASYDKAIIAGQDEATAIAMADSDVLASQGGGQLKDLAAIQRGPEALKLFTVFYGFMNTLYNLTAERVRQTSFKNPMQIASLSIDMLLLYAIPSMLVTVLKDALGGGDDDDEKLAERMALDNVSFLFGTMVGVREASGAAQMAAAEALDVQTPYFARYQGPAGLRFYSELQSSMNQASQGEIDRAFTKNAINLAGILLHLPGAQINRTIDGFNALIEGETDNPAALIGGAR